MGPAGMQAKREGQRGPTRVAQKRGVQSVRAGGGRRVAASYIGSPYADGSDGEPAFDAQGECVPRSPSPTLGWRHGDSLKTRAHRWPSPPLTDTDLESQRSRSPVAAGDDSRSDDEEGGLLGSGTLLDRSSATRREVLDSLRWRLEAEKSVKIGEQLQHLVMEQQHEISDLRAQLGDSRDDSVDKHSAEDGQLAELVQLRKDLRQARRDNEALGRRAVQEEERADKSLRELQAAEQEKRVAEQVSSTNFAAPSPSPAPSDLRRVQERRALSGKVDEVLRQVAKVRSERDLAVTELQDSEASAKDLEVCEHAHTCSGCSQLHALS